MDPVPQVTQTGGLSPGAPRDRGQPDEEPGTTGVPVGHGPSGPPAADAVPLNTAGKGGTHPATRFQILYTFIEVKCQFNSAVSLRLGTMYTGKSCNFVYSRNRQQNRMRFIVSRRLMALFHGKRL